MIDLRQGIKVNAMLGNNHRIGILKECKWLLPAGTVVLFKDVDNKRGTCTIETPIDDAWIEKNIKNGNGIRTINTCVCFPLGHVDEIII